MTKLTDTSAHQPLARGPGLWLLAAGVAVAAGAYLRLDSLGSRSLWLDELATWNVANMPFGASLSWGPEAIPPLYQLCVRALTDDPHPPEWLLRLPAALAGCLVVPAGWWLGRRLGDARVAGSLALLLACNAMQIEYSREARGYSLLVLGSVLSVGAWHALVTRPTRARAVAYAGVTALTFYAHVFVALTAAGQVAWWLTRMLRRPRSAPGGLPLLALGATVVLWAPLGVRLITRETGIATVLAWVPPASPVDSFDLLAGITAGWVWLAGALVPAVLIGLGGHFHWPLSLRKLFNSREDHRTNDAVPLMLWWLATSWLGLLLISWLAVPVMVARYLLPAAVPALLLPLVLARRWHRHGPLVLAGLGVVASLPEAWTVRSPDRLGFRELVAFLDQQVDADRDLVVQAVSSSAPDYIEMETLEFTYYPLKGVTVQPLAVEPAVHSTWGSALADPRRIYIATFLADPLPAIHNAGRGTEPFTLDDRRYEQLAFGPYRLLCVAPATDQPASE